VLLTSLLTLHVTPRGLEVLTTTTGLGLTLTTTIGVINWVHTHSANGGALALPAGTACLTGDLIHVITVSNSSDSCEAVFVKAANLTGWHFHKSPTTVAGSEDSLLTGSTSDLTTSHRGKLNVVNSGSERNVLKWHSVAGLRLDRLTGRNLVTDLEAGRREDISLHSISVLHEGDTAGTIGIVLDGENFSNDVDLAALKVDETILTLVTTTDVTAGDTTLVVTATALLERSGEAFFWVILGCYFLEARQHFIAVSWGNGSKTFQWHWTGPF